VATETIRERTKARDRQIRGSPHVAQKSGASMNVSSSATVRSRLRELHAQLNKNSETRVSETAPPPPAQQTA